MRVFLLDPSFAREREKESTEKLSVKGFKSARDQIFPGESHSSPSTQQQQRRIRLELPKEREKKKETRRFARARVFERSTHREMRSLFLLSLRIFPFESSSFGGKSFGGQTISLGIYFTLWSYSSPRTGAQKSKRNKDASHDAMISFFIVSSFVFFYACACAFCSARLKSGSLSLPNARRYLGFHTKDTHPK